MQKSDFASILYEALKAAGFKYHGKIDVSQLNIEEWAKLSPQHMAKRYAEQFSLAECNKILSILQDIYNENKRENYHYSLKDNILNRKLPNPEDYRFAITHCGLIKQSGERALTKYEWLPKNAPIYADAEAIQNLYKLMKATKLTSKQRDYVEEHQDDDNESLNKEINPDKLANLEYEVDRLARYFRSKNQQRKKNGELKNKTTTILSREIKRELPGIDREALRSNAEQINDITEEEEQGLEFLDDNKVVENSGLKSISKGTLFIMNKRMKMYRKIIKHQNIYIKELESQVLS
jgi:hypothetical protein